MRQGQVRQGQARRGWGGKSKRGVTSKDSLFQHHHHPNFDDFFPWAIAPFIGNQKKSFKKNIMENNQNVPHKSINSQLLTKSLVYISIASFFFPLDFSGKKACFVLCTVWRVGRDSNAGLLFCKNYYSMTNGRTDRQTEWIIELRKCNLKILSSSLSS